MINDKTQGGLWIMPHIEFADPDEISEYTDYDIASQYKDGLFDHPFNIEFTAYDSVKNQETKDEKNRYMLRIQHSAILVDFDNMTTENFESKIKNNKLNTEIRLGFNPDPYERRYNIISRTEHQSSQINDLFTYLAKKASINIANGRVKKEDLVAVAMRNNGIYEGSELTKTVPPDFSNNFQKAALKVTQDTLTGMANDLEQLQTNNLTFGQIIGKHITSKEDYKEKEAKSTALLSMIIQGIGPKHFLEALLDSHRATLRKPFHEDKYDAVDNFLGASEELQPALFTYIAKALPINSKYHKPLIQNYYKHLCK